MTYIIEKGIPVPKVEGRGRRGKYPFADMEPGDSVFFPGEVIKGKAYMAAMNHASGRDKRFVARRVRENDTAGIRIWRME